MPRPKPGSKPDRPPLWRVVAINALPGLLVGGQLAGLIFFLNPDLPFGPGSFLRALLLFGGLLGALSAVLLTPFTYRPRGRAARLLPWTLTVALAVAAALAWVHAARFGYYIPPGINVRLLKAALWLTVAALICFYTALLHGLQMRPYGLRTRIGLAVVAVVSIAVLVERREAFESPPEPPPLPSTYEAVARPGILVVGLDGATLDALLPLARQGQLPFFARLLEEGGHARLAGFSPFRPEALWTSLATGKLPYKHGILGPEVYAADYLGRGSHLRLLPVGIGPPLVSAAGLRPRRIAVAHRKAVAAWEVLARLGLPTGAVSWPATAAPDGALAFVFSERYFEGDLGAGSALPQELAERGVLFRVTTGELDLELVETFGTEVPHRLLQALAGDLWRETLSGFLLEQRPEARALFLRLPGLRDVSSRYYGGYSAVQFDGSAEASHQEAARLVTAYYRHLDKTVESLWQRLPGPRLLAVVSAYGVDAPHGLDKAWAVLTHSRQKGRFDGEPDGVLLLLGDGVEAGAFVPEASVIDVAPTLLYALRLPIAEDLDGRVLTEVLAPEFLARNPLTFVPSYDTLAPAAQRP